MESTRYEALKKAQQGILQAQESLFGILHGSAVLSRTIGEVIRDENDEDLGTILCIALALTTIASDLAGM